MQQSPEKYRKLSELLQEKNRRTLLYPAKNYIPNGKAEEFISIVGSDQYFVNMFCAANGVGKTASTINILTNIVYGPQNEFFQKPLFQKWPYAKRGRIISDPTTIKSKIIPEIEKWFPQNESTKMPEAHFEMGKEGKGYVCKIKTNTGWEIDLMSTEQDAKEFESADIGFVLIDEPMPKDKFMATLARGRLGMIVVWGFTPLTFSAWIKEWIDEHRGDTAQVVEAEVEENCFVEKTEYLTKNGWALLEDAKVGDVAATVNMETMAIEYQAVTDTINRDYDGNVVDLYGGIQCTPDHRIVGKFDGKDKFEIREACELYRGVRMLGCAENGYTGTLYDSPFPKRFTIGDWAEFLGWYISEGCVTGVKGAKKVNFSCYISQNYGAKRDRIRDLIARMGLPAHERKGDVWFSDKEIHQHLFPLGHSGQKYIPEYVFEWPRSVQEVFFQAMLDGDGDGVKRYFTTSEQLANDVQRLLTIMGYRSSLGQQKQSCKGFGSKKILYRVSKCYIPQIHVERKPIPKPYKGIVSCVTVPNGVLIVRSAKGKPLVVGNCKIHGVRGILEHANIKRMCDGMPEDEKEARIFGKFGHLIGRVHKLFRRSVHVIKPFPVDERRFSTYKALDPHPRTADHALYMSVDSKGTKYITGEVISEGSTPLLYERMKSLENAMHYRMEGRIIDPSAFNDDQHKDEKSVGSMLFDLGETYTRGSKDLMAGIKRTNDALDYQMIEGKMLRPPEIYIFDTCPVMIKQLEEYVWGEWKGASKDQKQAMARPLDRNDHNVENLHRLLMHNSVFVPYQMSSSVKSGPSWQDEINALDPYYRR